MYLAVLYIEVVDFRPLGRVERAVADRLRDVAVGQRRTAYRDVTAAVVRGKLVRVVGRKRPDPFFGCLLLPQR